LFVPTPAKAGVGLSGERKRPYYIAMVDRKTHWDKVYDHRSPLKVSWYQETPRLSLQLIRNTGIALDAPIIDIGGGASTLVDTLCDDGYTDISVLDITSKALNHSKKRLADRACTVEWFNEDVLDFESSKRFSVWHDRAVFHFLTDSADREKYVASVRRALAQNGQLIIMAFAIGGPLKCSGLEIVQYDADKLMGELGEGFKLLESGLDTHITPAGGEQEFAYFRFLRS
jgi:SAM-dependent methyltransferase